MNVKRNVEGLRQNAQKKRQAALDRVEQGIRQLLKDGGTINFNTVAQAAGVSKAFLYKESAIKERIDQLRRQGTRSKPLLKHKASDASKDNLIAILRERIKTLETENQALRRQNEVAYGQVIEVNSLRRQVERLQAENQRLASANASSLLSKECQSDVNLVANQSKTDVEQSSDRQSDIGHVASRLHQLGVSISPTFAKLIRSESSEVLNAAIDALEEALLNARVKEPEAFLSKAIQERWKPNSRYAKSREYELFNEWYNLARAYGIVQASIQQDGTQFVIINNEQIPFTEAIAEYSIEFLKAETKEGRQV